MPKKQQRPTMKGMDAFLQAPSPEEATHQEDSKPVEQHASRPVLMKGTYYIMPEHDMKLERVRLARKIKGQKVDKSALIREAIDLLQE